MSHKRKIDYKHWERGLSPQLLWKRNRNNTYKRDVLGMVLVMLFILLNAYITVYYTYLYLYIYYIFIIYITYNTIYTIHYDIAYFTLPKKINFIFIIYNTIFLSIFQVIGVETSSKHCGCSILYPTKSHLLTDENSHISSNNEGERTW